MHSMFVYCPSVLSSNRIKRYKAFKDFQERICVATDVFGRGIDIERINLAINYDLPADADSYLHRVGRAGRFGTKGLSISFVSSEADEEVLKSVEKRFEADIPYVLISLRFLCTLLTTLQGIPCRGYRLQHLHGKLDTPGYPPSTVRVQILLWGGRQKCTFHSTVLLISLPLMVRTRFHVDLSFWVSMLAN